MITFRIVLTGCLLSLGVPSAQAIDLPTGWSTDWDAATSRAVAEGKPIFAVFSATWCGPCQAMVKGIYPKQEVQATLQGWVPVYIDVDKQPNIARQYGVAALPTMVYLNPDRSEINRTIGAISTVDKMVELLQTKGGAKYEGGSRSPLVALQLKTLTRQIEAAPADVSLRRQRFELVLDEILATLSMEHLELAQDDLNAIGRLDGEVYAQLAEDRQLFRTLKSIQSQPQRAGNFLLEFLGHFPQGERAAMLQAFLARTTMKAARYDQCVEYMKDYQRRFPRGGYVDEFNLLLPQIEDFLKLTKGVTFD